MDSKLQLKDELALFGEELKRISSAKASLEELLEEERLTSAQLKDRIRDLEVICWSFLYLQQVCQNGSASFFKVEEAALQGALQKERDKMITFQKSTEKESSALVHKFHHEKKALKEQMMALQDNLQALK